MNVDEFFNEHPNVIKNMTMQNGNKMVDFMLGTNNIIPEDKIPDGIKVNQVNANQDFYQLRITTKDFSFEGVCDFISEILSFNEELEKKKELYRQKLEELKAIFNDDNYSLEQLKELKFVVGDDNEENHDNENDSVIKSDNNTIDEYNNGKAESFSKEELK